MPNKTIPTPISVTEFLSNYPNQKVIPDCLELVELFQKITGCDPVLWRTMIGYGDYHYKYASGREGDWFATGFAPSKAGITIYTNCYFENSLELLTKLGKHKVGKSCLYIKKLEDIDLEILAKLIVESYNFITIKYPKSV